MIVEDKSDPLYKIVAKFPKVIEYRNSLMRFERVDKYLMLIGGSYSEREACIDYVSGFSCQASDDQSCRDKADGILKKEVIDLEDCSDLFATVLQKIETRKSDRMAIDDKLFVLNDISCRHNHVLVEFGHRFSNPLNKPDFLIATTRDRNEVEELPQRWRDMFEEVNLTTLKSKRRIPNFASKDEIDKILMKYIRRYPYKRRKFVVEKALPELNEVFTDKDMYCEGTLITRLSTVRQKMMI